MNQQIPRCNRCGGPMVTDDDPVDPALACLWCAQRVEAKPIVDQSFFAVEKRRIWRNARRWPTR
jgi:hypothetical protein